MSVVARSYVPTADDLRRCAACDEWCAPFPDRDARECSACWYDAVTQGLPTVTEREDQAAKMVDVLFADSATLGELREALQREFFDCATLRAHCAAVYRALTDGKITDPFTFPRLVLEGMAVAGTA